MLSKTPVAREPMQAMAVATFTIARQALTGDVAFLTSSSPLMTLYCRCTCYPSSSVVDSSAGFPSTRLSRLIVVPVAFLQFPLHNHKHKINYLAFSDFISHKDILRGLTKGLWGFSAGIRRVAVLTDY